MWAAIWVTLKWQRSEQCLPEKKVRIICSRKQSLRVFVSGFRVKTNFLYAAQAMTKMLSEK